MKRIFIISFLLFGFSSCDDETLSREQELTSLEERFLEITTIAKSVPCENSEEWAFIGYGSKACGGPQGFIAFPLNLDTPVFLKKIESYRIAEEQFNKKWGVISDCALAPAPTSVTCENGEAILIY